MIMIHLINDFIQAYPNCQLDFLFSNSLSDPLANDEVDLSDQAKLSGKWFRKGGRPR